MIVSGTAGFVAELEHSHRAGVVKVEWDFTHFAKRIADFCKVVGRNITGTNMPRIDSGSGGNHTINNLIFCHLHREEEDAALINASNVIG